MMPDRTHLSLSFALIATSLAVFVIGITGIIGNVLKSSGLATWGGQQPIALPAAAGLVLVGVCLVWLPITRG